MTSVLEKTIIFLCNWIWKWIGIGSEKQFSKSLKDIVDTQWGHNREKLVNGFHVYLYRRYIYFDQLFRSSFSGMEKVGKRNIKQQRSIRVLKESKLQRHLLGKRGNIRQQRSIKVSKESKLQGHLLGKRGNKDQGQKPSPSPHTIATSS